MQKRPGHLILSLEEGVELARRKNRHLYGELLARDAESPARL